jgi:TPR repeat protein
MVNHTTPKELNDLGDQYFYGQGVDKNIEIAFTYYKRAADQNNPVGLANVGKYFLSKNDKKQAFEYYQRSADAGFPLAYIKLSDMYLNGIGVKKNKKKAFKMMEKAVKLNEIDSYHLLGKYHLLGLGTKKNEAKAQEMFELSANSNNTEGMFLLGQLLIEGKKIKNDFDSAFFYLDKAAVNNNLHAINYLKDLYNTPHDYLKKKSELYRKEMWFYYDELLANLDDVEALKRCSFAYYQGDEPVKINFEKSIKYFKILHGLDETLGYLGMGLSYLYGQGVNVDLERARDYLEIAQTRGNSKAKNALGDIYRLGKGVEVDYSRARDYYLEAAKENEVDALINLGLLHYRKQVSSANDALALQFMTRANEAQSAAASYWLGVFADKAIGQPRSVDLARKHYEKAIELGNVGAKYKLAQLLYDDVKATKMSKKKADKNFITIKELLVDYINNPLNQDVNALYSMSLLAEIYENEAFSEYSPKVSRYWYELAAEKGFSKAQVKMYELLNNKEPERALYWLETACEHPADGEELYQMALVYEQGLFGIPQSKKKADEYLQKAAKFNHKQAIMKMTMPEM